MLRGKGFRSASVTALAAFVLLAGCGPGAGGAPAAKPGTMSPTAPADVEIAVTVRAGQVIPAPARRTVASGQVVRLTVISDVADSLHVHGYDLVLDLPAGTPATMQFKAVPTGLYEVETHTGGLMLLQLVVS